MQTDREDKLENTEISKSKKKLPKQTLSEQQKKKLLEMEKAIQEHQQSGKAFVVAAALRCISEEKLYIPDKTIYAYAIRKFSFSRRMTNTYICSSYVYESIVQDSSLPIPENISHIRSLHKYSPAIRRLIWKQLIDSGMTITEDNVLAVTVQFESGINFTDINNELYTPKAIINAAKSVVTGNVFHLDPCSTTYANNIHEGKLALHFFDEYQNGLVQHWHGNVWLSPPTSSSNLWFMAAETKFITGEISSCFCLLKSDFCEEWFQQALKYPHCILKERISFYTPTGREKSFTDTSYTVVYMGGNNNLFGQVFSKLGSIPGYNSWAFQDKSALESFVLQQIPNIEQTLLSRNPFLNTDDITHNIYEYSNMQK